MATMTPFSNGEAWADAIEQMYSCPEWEVEAKIEHIYAEDCAIIIMGNKMSRTGLVGYIKSIRESHTAVRIHSQRWLRHANAFAEKHTAIAHRNDSTTTEGEVWVMGELNADGKLVLFEEILRLTSGSLDKELKS